MHKPGNKIDITNVIEYIMSFLAHKIQYNINLKKGIFILITRFGKCLSCMERNVWQRIRIQREILFESPQHKVFLYFNLPVSELWIICDDI